MQKGMQPYPKKCKNIRNKKSPGNAQELLSFLGLIQYLSPFILHLATNTKLLRQLLKKDTPWEWNAEHEQAFIDLKDAIKLLRSTVSEEVVKYCKELFSLHGIPKKFYTDNGPRYACRQWREFAKD
jgi:protoheme ferro-lyase